MKAGVGILIVALVVIIAAAVVFIIRHKRNKGCDYENNLTQTERLNAGLLGAPRTGRCIQTEGSGAGTFATKSECDSSSVCTVSQKFSCGGEGKDCVEDPNGTFITHPSADGGDTAAVLAECKNQCNLPIIPSGTYTINRSDIQVVKQNRANNSLYVATTTATTAQSEATPIIYDATAGTLYINDAVKPGFLSNKTGRFSQYNYPLVVATATVDEKGWILKPIFNPNNPNLTFEIWGKAGKLIYSNETQTDPLVFIPFDIITANSRFHLNKVLALGWKCEGV